MRLPAFALRSLSSRRVETFYANRGTVQFWNERRMKGELRYFCGWYWYAKDRKGRAETQECGPFRTETAALRDAYQKLQLQPN